MPSLNRSLLSEVDSATTAVNVSDGLPLNPQQGQLWYESDTGKTFVYYDSFWIEIVGSVGGQGVQGVAGATGATGPEGGTSTLTTKADLLTRTSSAVARLGVGANDTVLMARSAETTGLAWDVPRLAGGAARPLISGGAYLSGSGLVLSGSGNNASSPDSAALDVTGDIDIKAKVTLANWAPGTFYTLTGKYGSTGQLSYVFMINSDGTLFFAHSADGTNLTNTISTVATGFANGSTNWVRITMDVDNGSSQRVRKFYTSSDGTTWTQLGSTITDAGTTSIFNSTSVLEIGTRLGGTATFALVGTIHRVIIQSAYDTANNTDNLVYDANFETATADALAFTESSTNAATVTINTNRYTYGVPNAAWVSVSTTNFAANTDYYCPFQVTSPIVFDMFQFEVTTGPASNATMYMAVYASDNNMQPTGSPLATASQAISASQTGVFRQQITPVTLQPGSYLVAFNLSVATSLRFVRGITNTVLGAMGSNSIIQTVTVARTNAAFTSSPLAFTTLGAANLPLIHGVFLRWRAA